MLLQSGYSQNTFVVDSEVVKAKVLFIMHLPPPVHGAAMAGSYIKNSKLINTEFDTTYLNLATNMHLNQSGKGSIKKVIAFLQIVKTAIKTLNKRQFDICYLSLTATGLGFYKDLLIVMILKLYGRKIIYHFHNKGVSQAPKTTINRFLYSLVFKNTKSILLSPHLYYDIKAYVNEKDVYYCPNGIPPIYPEIEKKIITENAATCKFLYLSNMMVEKGAYVLLDAVEDLNKRNLSFECHYVGGWSDITEDAFNNKVRESGLENVVFAHGPKYGSEKHSFFNEADVFLFPTFYHYETFGLVNLEAMQYSLPVISTPEGGIPDVVVDGETGYLVTQRDSKQLADKLEFLIHRPELRAKMGMAGKERFKSHFTLEKFERNFVNIIKKALH